MLWDAMWQVMETTHNDMDVCPGIHGTVGSLRRVRFTYPLRPLAYNPVQLADRRLPDLVS